MRGEEFLDKMELIEASYVEQAGEMPPGRKKNLAGWGALAACFAVAVAAALLFIPRADAKPDPEEYLQPDSGVQQLEKDPEKTPDRVITGPGSAEYVHPVHTPEPANPDSGYVFGPHDNTEVIPVIPCISSYGEGVFTVDMAVENGGVHITNSLRSAMEHYGDSATYKVMLVLFSDGVHIPSVGDAVEREAERLFELGYTTSMQTIGEPGGSEEHYFYLLNATCAQLEEFPAGEDFGYQLVLYDEYTGRPSHSDTIIFKGFAKGE